MPTRCTSAATPIAFRRSSSSRALMDRGKRDKFGPPSSSMYISDSNYYLLLVSLLVLVMTSYFRSWLYGGTSVAEPAPPPVPTLRTISPQASDDEGEATETEDDDRPPAFPALNSAQRAPSSSIPKVLTDSQLMPPPPIPSLAVRQPGVSRSPGASLAVPLTTTKAPSKTGKKSRKVVLAPGHSPLDWAALKSSGEDLRGVDTLTRIPPSVLKLHNKPEDVWCAISGKVYNITPYLSYHPGGEKELMRVAGRDGTKLFALTHAWVNADFMLDACMVGFLVPEPTS